MSALEIACLVFLYLLQAACWCCAGATVNEFSNNNRDDYKVFAMCVGATAIGLSAVGALLIWGR